LAPRGNGAIVHRVRGLPSPLANVGLAFIMGPCLRPRWQTLGMSSDASSGYKPSRSAGWGSKLYVRSVLPGLRDPGVYRTGHCLSGSPTPAFLESRPKDPPSAEPTARVTKEWFPWLASCNCGPMNLSIAAIELFCISRPSAVTKCRWRRSDGLRSGSKISAVY